jgi:hypothetical protein|tara:strand:+ start:342 stop:527 length:186 start_codon:yes stop_codon:yes gene_type:complete
LEASTSGNGSGDFSLGAGVLIANPLLACSSSAFFSSILTFSFFSSTLASVSYDFFSGTGSN